GHRELRLELFESLCAHALDVLQLLDRLEAAVRVAVIEDRLRLGRPDARQGDQLVLSGGVEVDGSRRPLRRQGYGERERGREDPAKHGSSPWRKNLARLPWRNRNCADR